MDKQAERRIAAKWRSHFRDGGELPDACPGCYGTFVHAYDCPETDASEPVERLVPPPESGGDDDGS